MASMRKKPTTIKKNKSQRVKRSVKRSSSKNKDSFSFLGLFIKILLLFSIITVGYLGYLDHIVRTQFEGKRWALPAHVYANPVELYQGYSISISEFEALLSDLHYRKDPQLSSSATYRRSGTSFTIKTRPFEFSDSNEASRLVKISFQGQKVLKITELQPRRSIAILRLDPARVGSFYPTHKEDRILVQIDNVPQTLTDALVAIEDRGFYHHYGVSPKAILRALWVNIQAGGVVQGGSTLTQQLVKNFFLTSERSLWRKIKEALMALILEAHYEKDDILEAYLNEVFLGQVNEVSIHGFGMASVFYFNQPLRELKPHQVALLVGMVKGPSYYEPRRHPSRALKRRNLVLDEMVRLDFLPQQQLKMAKRHGLGVTDKKQLKTDRFPAFLDLVKRQLSRDYEEADLTSDGLKIFSTLDYRVQVQAEKKFVETLNKLSRQYGFKKGSLQGAMVISRRETGEIVAVIGDRNPKFSGFNRALDAIRPIGSLVKPAVYLTALDDPSQYTLITPIEDKAIQLKQADGSLWEPRNYDKKEHGDVPLHTALANSYNLATVRLGIDIKVANVRTTLERLGISRPIKPYPSLLLGAIPLSPIEVTQMYQTLASDGFLTPLRSIQSVLSASSEPLQMYPLTVRQTVSASATYLTNVALQEVMRTGTGKSAYQQISPEYQLAGKTGTTDELRDSWFAGFSGDYVAVVWLGRDDNKPSKLTGASGALQVWASVMKDISKQAVQLIVPSDIEYIWIDAQGLRANEFCSGAVQYPFIKGSSPTVFSPCVGAVGKTLERASRWFDRLLND